MPSELKLVFGPKEAKHLIFANSLLKSFGGKRVDGTVFGGGLEYGVFVRSGAHLPDLLKDAAAHLAGLPEDDKARRTCIVQVITKKISL